MNLSTTYELFKQGVIHNNVWSANAFLAKFASWKSREKN